MPGDYLYQLADALLTRALLGLSAARTGVPEPGKIYVAWGDPVADLDGCCPDGTGEGGGQLTVHQGGPTADPLDFTPPSPTQQCQLLTRTNMTVTLMRCAPVLSGDGSAPDAQELDDAARQLMVDEWALVTQLRADRRDSALWPGAVACPEIRMTNTTILDPLGGCAGFQLTMSFLTNDTGP